MKKLIIILLLIPLISNGQKIKGEKLFSIKASIGEWQSSIGEYLNLKTIYAPYTKGVFEGITSGKVLPVGGDFPLYHQENGKTYADLDIDLFLIKKAEMWDDNIDVCVIFVPEVSSEELSRLVDSINKRYLMGNDFVALEDHPDDEENINGVIMNNGKYPIVLMQRLSKIQMFSGFLKKKGYYDVWSKENLDDVVNWRTHHEDLEEI